MSRPEKFWDNQAGHFTEDLNTVELTKNKDYNTLLRYLTADDTVLDFGCATGIVSNAIADKAREIQGIDISPRMIDIAKDIAREKELDNTHYAATTLFEAAYESESFDLIYAFRVLHVLPDSRAVLRRIYDLLKPGGVFISVTTCIGSWKYLIGWISSLLRKTNILPVSIQYFKLSDLQGLMVGEGFAILEHEKMDDRVPNYCVVAKKPR